MIECVSRVTSVLNYGRDESSGVLLLAAGDARLAAITAYRAGLKGLLMALNALTTHTTRFFRQPSVHCVGEAQYSL